MPENSQPDLIRWRNDVDWRIKNLEDNKGEMLKHITRLGVEKKNFDTAVSEQIKELRARADKNDQDRIAEQKRFMLKAIGFMVTAIGVLVGIIWNARDAIL